MVLIWPAIKDLRKENGTMAIQWFPGHMNVTRKAISSKAKGTVVECGQHFLRSASELATQVAQDFLAHFGLIEGAPAAAAPGMQRRFELLRTCVIKTPEFRFVRPVIGFEVFAKDELIAIDGPDEIRAPCDDCTILMPARAAIVGREAVYLTRPM